MIVINVLFIYILDMRLVDFPLASLEDGELAIRRDYKWIGIHVLIKGIYIISQRNK